MHRRSALLLAAGYAMLAGPAEAGPVVAVVSAVATWVGGSVVAQTLLNLGIGLALSAFQRARQKQPDRPGIKIEQTLVGDTNPDAFILGRSGTAGVFVGPHRTHGKNNKYLTMVIDLGGVPGMTLEDVFVNGERRPLRYDKVNFYGVPIEMPGDARTKTVYDFSAGKNRRVETDFDPRLWVRFHGGDQTAADTMLRDRYGSDPDYPWTSDMIGRGRCYAIVTAKWHPDRMTQIPQFRFGLLGIPLYDPRLDDAVEGGSGGHRWGDPSTWQPSENSAVQAYNILRGIAIGPDVWSDGCDADAIPLDSAIAAMNEADLDLGGEPQYRSGTEVLVDEEPVEVLERIMRTCSGAIAEAGGIYTIRVGAPTAPVHWITDADIVVSRAQQLDPFPGLAETINGVSITHPDPNTAWEMREAPVVINDELEAEDDGRRLRETLALEALPYGKQGQRVGRSYVLDARRFRRHGIPLPADASHLRPLEVLAWSSARNGYVDKLFEIGERVFDPLSRMSQLSIREVDPSDYDHDPTAILPITSPPLIRTPPMLESPVFEAYGTSIEDDDGVARLAAIFVAWEADEEGPLDLEVRLASTGAPVLWLGGHVPEGQATLISQGIVAALRYEIRARYSTGVGTAAWSTWKAVDVPGVVVPVANLDTSPPDPPTDLVFLSELTEDGRARLVATWSPSPSSDVAHYDIEVAEDGSGPVRAMTTENRHQWTLLPGIPVTGRVRAIDRAGNTSTWTASVAHTTIRDEVPPAVPAQLTATAGFGAMWLTWAAVDDIDLSHYELCEKVYSSTPAENTTAARFRSTSTSFARTGLPAETTRHYWVRAYDTSGNRSAWSEIASATTPPSEAVTTEALEGLIDETSFAQGIQGVVVVATVEDLPATGINAGRMAVVTTTGQVYRYNGGWTASVDGTEITPGSITTPALAAGAVQTDQLDVRAVTASRILLTDTANLIPDGTFEGRDPALVNPLGGSVSFVSIAGGTGANALQWTRPAGSAIDVRQALPYAAAVRAGASYRLETRLKAAAAGLGNVLRSRIFFLDANKVVLTGTGSVATTPQYDVGTDFVTQSLIAVAPVGAVYAFWSVLAQDPAQATDLIIDRVSLRLMDGAELTVDGSIKSRHLVTGEAVITGAAQIASAIIGDAHVLDLSAAKLRAGTALASTVTVSGTALSTINARADDPAARINSRVTQIDPGRIKIGTGTSLHDWIGGTDNTEIDGGRVAANTIRANSIEVGARNVQVAGIEFSADRNTSQLSWTAGSIEYKGDTGLPIAVEVAAGSAAWTAGTLYVYWVKDAGALSVTENIADGYLSDRVILASYRGQSNLNAHFGRVVIDGYGIRAGSIRAGNIDTADFSANGLAVFGGNIRSSNFVSGKNGSGWRISNDGNAEFGTLALREGAVNFYTSASRRSYAVVDHRPNYDYDPDEVGYYKANFLTTTLYPDQSNTRYDAFFYGVVNCRYMRVNIQRNTDSKCWNNNAHMATVGQESTVTIVASFTNVLGPLSVKILLVGTVSLNGETNIFAANTVLRGNYR